MAAPVFQPPSLAEMRSWPNAPLPLFQMSGEWVLMSSLDDDWFVEGGVINGYIRGGSWDEVTHRYDYTLTARQKTVEVSERVLLVARPYSKAGEWQDLSVCLLTYSPKTQKRIKKDLPSTPTSLFKRPSDGSYGGGKFLAKGNLNKFFCNMNNPDNEENQWAESKEDARKVKGKSEASWIFLPDRNYGLLNWSW